MQTARMLDLKLVLLEPAPFSRYSPDDSWVYHTRILAEANKRLQLSHSMRILKEADGCELTTQKFKGQRRQYPNRCRPN
jgi:hypothetical protein